MTSQNAIQRRGSAIVHYVQHMNVEILTRGFIVQETLSSYHIGEFIDGC
jgi:hypothetical protein